MLRNHESATTRCGSCTDGDRSGTVCNDKSTSSLRVATHEVAFRFIRLSSLYGPMTKFHRTCVFCAQPQRLRCRVREPSRKSRVLGCLEKGKKVCREKRFRGEISLRNVLLRSCKIRCVQASRSRSAKRLKKSAIFWEFEHREVLKASSQVYFLIRRIILFDCVSKHI